MKILLCFILLSLSAQLLAKPNIIVKHQRNENNHAEIQVLNKTKEILICYVAIDGHKIHFHLPPWKSSIWYRATDPRFNYKNFSTWCDYLALYPKYQHPQFYY